MKNKIINFFRSNLQEKEIITDSVQLSKFTSDQRGRYTFDTDFILQPKNLKSVQSILKICNENKIYITCQGGNTSLCGASIPQFSNSVIVSLSSLNKLIDINLIDNSIIVESGMILKDVQEIAKSSNRLFPLSFASEDKCQIGGNIACNSGGINVLNYGTARNLVLGLEVVLPNGEIISHLNPVYKSTLGYDLKHLFIGSEGTLGIITKACLKLFSLPKNKFTFFSCCNSFSQINNLFILLKDNFSRELTSFEIINNFALDISSSFSGIKIPINVNKWYVLFELSDFNNNIDNKFISDLLLKNNFRENIFVSDNKRDDIWKLRKNLSLAQKNFGLSIKHDISLPISNIEGFIEKNSLNLKKQFPKCLLSIFGHYGDGSLHYNVFIRDILDSKIYNYESKINEIVYTDVLNYYGVIAGEHGIGQLKNFWLSKMLSDYELDIMKKIKKQFDPNFIMNPGKIFIK